MPKRFAKTYSEAMMEIVGRWETSGGQWPAPSEEIARFAIHNKLWQPPKSNAVKQCARDLSRAMREVNYTDPQGRSVRTLHAARYIGEDKAGQKTPRMLWADMRDPSTSRDHMENAFQLRRRQILSDCWQLKTDADSFNENHPQSSPIQLVFDFTEDLAEMEQPEEYRPGDYDDD